MRSALIANVAVAAMLFGGGTAFAKDAVEASVSIPAGERLPVMTENGTGYTPGTYAVGDIHLDYTYVGTKFPEGLFATFNLSMKIKAVANGPSTSYPVTLDLTDIGSENVTLWTSSPLEVSNRQWNTSVPVTISIPSFVAADPLLNEDGDVLVGNFKLAADSELKTVTNVKVRIKLVHPAPTACLKVYDFITDEKLTDIITSTEVGVNPRGKVTSTNPYGSLSQNLMVVNTCETPETFDAKLALDANFSTQPNNNPGNAVFTFATSGEIDPATFAIGSFGLGTAKGQALCLQNVSVPGGTTFLATVHMSINNGMAGTSLPVGGTFSGFGATLFYTADVGCSGDALPLSVATPNPVSAPLSFTIR